MTEQHPEYTASSIKILTDEQVLEAFDWAKIGALAAQYHRDPDYIERGLQACARVGVHYSYFVRRYLEGDKTVTLHEGVNAAMLDILKENRGR